MASLLGLGELSEEKPSVGYGSDPWDAWEEANDTNTDLDMHRAVRYRANVNKEVLFTMYNHV